MLTWTIWISFLGAGVVALMPRERRGLIRWTALAFSAGGLALGLGAFFSYDLHAGGFQFGNGEGSAWIPQIGATWRMGVDGISLPLVVLTGFIALTGVLYSWNVERRVNEFFALYLLLIGGVYGVFQARDLFLLLLFYEVAIIPKYFLIAIWGSTRKEYAAMKLALYSFVGSAMVFLVMAVICFTAGSSGRTFDLEKLASAGFSPSFQVWAFPVVFLGFAILAGMWPFHTWAPTGHVAAPTAASMLLAGVVMKLGAYGCLRVAITVFPAGMSATLLGVPHFWKWGIAILGAVGIFYGAMVALVQRDFKFVIGYSSVSHMGFVLLGLAAMNLAGVSGAVMQMFSHGVVAGLLFATVGRMVYDRTHTRQLDELGGLFHALPFAGTIFILAALASMGLPGLSGFPAELLVMMGTWRSFPILLAAVGFGVVVTVVYTLRTIHLAFFAEPRDGAADRWKGLPSITMPEKVASLVLAALLLLVGCYPPILLKMVERSSQQLLNHVKQSLPVNIARDGSGH